MVGRDATISQQNKMLELHVRLISVARRLFKRSFVWQDVRDRRCLRTVHNQQILVCIPSVPSSAGIRDEIIRAVGNDVDFTAYTKILAITPYVSDCVG